MSSERAVPFASKPPEGWDDHVEVMRATRMFLLQTKGPTRFVVRGEKSDRKFTVLVGSRARCSCGVSLCLHHLFVMLKVLKVLPSNPLAWQTALIDNEVDCILGGGNSGDSKVGGRPGVGGGAPPPGQPREFLRRGAGRTSAGGTGSSKETGGDAGVGGEGAGVGGTRRLKIVPGEVCPVCQEEMEEDDGSEGEGDGGGIVAAAAAAAAGGAAEGRLTYCRDGCGNNMHARCMLMYAEHRRSSGDKPCCPLCRVDWGLTAVRALREDARPHGQGKSGGRLPGRRAGGSGGAAATVTRAGVVPVTCRSCSVKVQAAFFRCLVCAPAGSWDLCRRCYAMSGVRRSSYGGSSTIGSCAPVGRRRHPFVQGEAATDPPEWKPADPPDSGRRADSAAAAGVISLQGREITTADFELLLTLDASQVAPLHEHLLRALPPCDGTEANGGGGGGGGGNGGGYIPSLLPPTPLLMHQQQPGPATVASGYLRNIFSPSRLLLGSSVEGGERVDNSSSTNASTSGRGIDNAGGDNRHISEGLPLTNSGLPSQLGGQQATVVAAMMSPSSSSSTVPPPSLRALVAAAAVARDSAPAAAAALGDEAAAVGEGAEATGISEDSVMTTTAVPPVPSDEVAPVSGSFTTAAPVTCICCSHIDAVGDTSRSTGDNAHNASNTNDPPRSALTARTGRQRPPPTSSSSSSPAPSSQALFRRLPCGHSAHEACLIPLILESVGRGDPSRCLCPLDSSPIFPVLSRHRPRVRRRRPGTDGSASTAAAVSAARDDHRRGTRSASSAAAPPASRAAGGIDRHARAAAAREVLRRNVAAGFSGGGVNPPDILGITLFGSGLAQPPLPPPQSSTTHATATMSPPGPHPGEGGQCDNRTLSVRESGLMRRRAGANGKKEGDKGSGGGGNGIRGRRNVDRSVDGDAGPREASFCGNSRLRSTALFLGGEGIMDAAGGASAAARPAYMDCDVGTAARSQRHQQRKPPRVVRGSTISSNGGGGRIRHRSNSTGRARNDNEACTSAGRAVGAAGSANGLALTALPLATSATGGANYRRRAVGHSPSQESGDEIGGRGSGGGGGRGRGGRGDLVDDGEDPSTSTSALSISLPVADATVEERPSGQPISVDGMALVAAVV